MSSSGSYPHVVIIGRPNVGKSTLFNRLFGRRRAIVHHEPGTTRDRNEAMLSWKGKEFMLVDTGGWAGHAAIFPDEVRKQTELALKEAEVVLFVVDGKSGLHPLDVEISNTLRRHDKKRILVVNKIDTLQDELKAAEFHRLAVGDMVLISAEHGRNIFELMDAVSGNLAAPGASAETPAAPPVRIILVGKPNVGKSSLVNALCREPRCIVHNVPGTTREAIDISIKRDTQDFVLIDTPGLHRRRKFRSDLEYLASLSTHHAMERADVAVLVMDVEQEIGDTEAKIAELIIENHRACLLAINKWDLVENKETAVKVIRHHLEERLPFLWWSRVLFLSAKSGLRVEKILNEVLTVYREYSRVVPEEELREVIRAAEGKKPLSRHGKVLRIKTVTQIGIHPPAFELVVNDLDLVHFSYRRYLENALREHFGFSGTPILLKFHSERNRRRGKR